MSIQFQHLHVLQNSHLPFSLEGISHKKFKETYTSSGWLCRKCTAVPVALYLLVTAIANVVYSTLFCISRLHCKVHLFYAIRDLQEAFGRLVTLFSDYRGLYIVENVRTQKVAYGVLHKAANDDWKTNWLSIEAFLKLPNQAQKYPKYASVSPPYRSLVTVGDVKYNTRRFQLATMDPNLLANLPLSEFTYAPNFELKMVQERLAAVVGSRETGSIGEFLAARGDILKGYMKDLPASLCMLLNLEQVLELDLKSLTLYQLEGISCGNRIIVSLLARLPDDQLQYLVETVSTNWHTGLTADHYQRLDFTRFTQEKLAEVVGDAFPSIPHPINTWAHLLKASQLYSLSDDQFNALDLTKLDSTALGLALCSPSDRMKKKIQALSKNEQETIEPKLSIPRYQIAFKKIVNEGAPV